MDGVVPNEEHIQLLCSMGFTNDTEVRRALRLAKNDINEAVSLLTNEVPGLHDVEMTVPTSSTVENCQTSTDNVENMDVDESTDSLEFPTTHLYELESRVFTSSWSIPYKKEESLGRCLVASIKLAKEGLTESDENCRRFVESCMPACFDKLLTAYQVNRWGQEVQEGIYQMLQLFMDLICTRLQHDPLPWRMLDVLANCFDPNTNYHQKNNRKPWDKVQWELEFGSNNVYAEPSSQFDEPYGYLISIINRFAVKNGFDNLVKKFETNSLNAFEMFHTLKPFSFCVDFLSPTVTGPFIRTFIDVVLLQFPTLSEIDAKKGTSSSIIVDLLGHVKNLLTNLFKSLDEANVVDDLRLSFILKLLKSSNYGLRMHALKELTKLLEMLTSPNKMDERMSIQSDKLSQWLSGNEVLSLALEGNIDQAQYCDRLRTLLVFLGPRLSCQDVTKIWSLRRGRAAVTVDNVHTIVTQAATKFGSQELDHLLSLIQKSWSGEGERSKEKLVSVLGKIGLETSVSYTYEQVAELLWKFAHQQPKISIPLVNLCLEEHQTVVTASGRDSLRTEYITKCLNDIKEGVFVLPAMAQLHGLVESIKKSGYNAAKSQKSVISDLVNKRQLVESLCDNLIRMHKLALEMWQQKNIKMKPICLPATAMAMADGALPSSSSSNNLPTVQSLSIQTPNAGGTSSDPRKPSENDFEDFGPDFLLPNGFTYGYHIDAILDFLRFVLVAGELFLLIHRCQELWDTLIADQHACFYSKEAGFSWFLKGISDLEKNCQLQLFQDRMLKLDPTKYTPTGFACFRRYFESVNGNEQKLRLSVYGPQTFEVEKPDLIGLDYIWQMTLNCIDEQLAKEAVELLIAVNYTYLTNRLKQKDPANLHKKFLSECYRRLESSILTLKRSPVVEFLNRSAKILAAPSVPAIIDIPPPEKHQKIRNIERLLLIAETYVKTVENSQAPGMIRVTPAHGSSFFGNCFTLSINYEDSTSTPTYKKENVEVVVDENETLGMIRERLAAIFAVEYNRMTLEFDGKELVFNHDHQVLRKLGVVAPSSPSEKQILIAKRRFLSTFVSSFDSSSKTSEIKSVGGFKQQQALDQERNLPAVVMAQDRQVFDILYQLVNFEEVTVTTRVRELLLLIPSDSGVIEILDNLTNAMNAVTASASSSSGVSSKTNSLDRKSTTKSGETISEKLAAFASGGGSPKSKHKQQTPEKEMQKAKDAAEFLKLLLDISSPGFNAFRLLYNLEVLSGRLLPTSYLDSQTLLSAQQFAIGFVHIGGVQFLVNILKKDFLPPNTDAVLRQIIYERVLQLLNYLLCDKSTLHLILDSQKRQINIAKSASSMTTSMESDRKFEATAAKADSHVAAETLAQNAWLTLEPPNSSIAAKDLTVESFASILETLQRLSWAAAGGILHLIGSDLKSPNVTGGSSGGPSWFLASPRSRTSESSTGSSDSETPSNLHSGVSSCHTTTTPEDVYIAKQSLRLLVDCVLIRPLDMQIFFHLPHISDFVLDLLLVTDSVDVRKAAEEQFYQISKTTTNCYSNFMSSSTTSTICSSQTSLRKAILRSHNSHQSPQSSTPAEAQSPRSLLFTILLRAPLPLWTMSSNVRGSTQRLLGQCGEYFSLRGRLLAELSPQELSSVQPPPSQMLEDEAHWILGFSCSSNALLVASDNVLLTGHLELITVLVRLLPEHKLKYGQMLIGPLLDEFLFPSAKLVNRSRKDEVALRRAKAADVRAKCQKHECRSAAFSLLLELCKNCYENYQSLTQCLCLLHHQSSPELSNEWDYSPLVEARMDNGFVGLKNAGATCYMNAVLQQFFMEQGLADSILSAEIDDNDDSIKLFRELQRLFGHLKESEQQYYVPKMFWDVFKLWGQQVNPREQQDAFEFFNCLIDQIDEILKKNGKEEIFRQRYQGVFSDQKICQGCPHRYEREEAFCALNLPVRAHNLEESLNNFVKGEILEGDNAYFCEKCGQKRTALKRMCIKSLPPVMVIQLKRFGYDWEENRALKFNDAFQFPLQLDFFPYTSNALAQLEGGEDWDLGTSPVLSASPFSQYLNSPSGIASSPVGGTPTGRPRRHTTRLSLMGVSDSIRYELVGAIVHSGQANAGHYYAFIKDRRDDAVINGTFNRWFKFNDTTVELVEMTEQYMEVELFGGKYTAKTDKSSMYPEERERYWNAYLLFYRRLGSGGESRTPRLTSKRSVSMSCSNTPQNKKRRDSLMELAELVEQGEQLQLFCNDGGPPSWLRTEIQEENFRFARNRDVFNADYLDFVRRLIELGFSSSDNHHQERSSSSNERFALTCAEFSLEFLLNTAWHCKKSLRGDPQVWTDKLINLNTLYPSVCRYFAQYFVDHSEMLKSFLLDCTSLDVRQSFSTFVSKILMQCVHADDDEMDGRRRCAALLQRLLALVGKEAMERWQNCTSLFYIFYRITCVSGEASKILLEEHAFSTLLNFMLQVSSPTESPEHQSLSSSPITKTANNVALATSLSRRWPMNQARELSDVYCTLSALMMQCNFSAYWTTSGGGGHYEPKNLIVDILEPKLSPVPDMALIVGGRLMHGFVKELVWAASNVYNCSNTLCELILYLIWKNEKIGRRFIVELLQSLAISPSNELKSVFTILETILLLNGDDLESFRIDLVLDGCKGGGERERVEGLLAIVKTAQITDSRRSYGCVKFLVKASEKCLELKNALNKRLEHWQWAVDWLKGRMEDEEKASDTNATGSPEFGIPGPVQQPNTSSGVGGGKLTVPSSHMSNDDSTTRHFQRTVSAQYTLDQAKALLTEFERQDSTDGRPASSSPPLSNQTCVIEMGDVEINDVSTTDESTLMNRRSISPAVLPQLSPRVPLRPLVVPPRSSSPVVATASSTSSLSTSPSKKDGKKTGSSVFYIDST